MATKTKKTAKTPRKKNCSTGRRPNRSPKHTASRHEDRRPLREDPFRQKGLPPLADAPDPMTIEEFRAYSGLGKTFVYDAIKRDKIPSIRIGGSIRIPKSVLLPSAPSA